MLPPAEPINCPACGICVIKDFKLLNHYLLKEDLLCPECQAVVVPVRQTLLNSYQFVKNY